MILISFSMLLDFSTRVILQYLVLIFTKARALKLISAPQQAEDTWLPMQTEGSD